MKKNIRNTVFFLLLMVGFSSCVSQWLNNYPEDQIVLAKYWKSAADVDATVTACYRYMVNNDYMLRLFYWGELRSDNVVLNSASTDETNLWNMNIMTSNTITQWNAFYKVINYCNTVLYYAPQAKENDANFKEFEYQAYLSEALTIRAYSYFQLVRTFGNVPLVVNPSKDDSQDFNVPQNTERQILDQIISDLQLAETYARDTWPTIAQTKGRVTKNAVRALLADVYLWDQQYANCIVKCNDVINDNNNKVELMEPAYLFNKVFYDGNSSESIFELNFSTSGMLNTMTSDMYGNDVKGQSANVKASSSIYAAYNATTDLRCSSFMCYKKAAVSYFIFKYEGQSFSRDINNNGYNYTYRSASSTANWILYRLSDIYLMKAEALAESSSPEDLHQAVILVNKTYARANTNLSDNTVDSLNYMSYSTTSAVRKLVLEERRREFAFEGKRWFDLLRMTRKEGTTANAAQYLIPAYTDQALITEKLSQPGAWYLPINQTQISIDTLLHQNSYYSAIFGTN